MVELLLYYGPKSVKGYVDMSMLARFLDRSCVNPDRKHLLVCYMPTYLPHALVYSL